MKGMVNSLNASVATGIYHFRNNATKKEKLNRFFGKLTILLIWLVFFMLTSL